MDRNKLRDLLRKARTFIECSPLKRVENDSGCIDRDMICAEIDAALAPPARNCDRFTNETDAQIAFLNEVCLIGVTSLKDDPFDGWAKQMKERYVQWLLAPATETEGGAE